MEAEEALAPRSARPFAGETLDDCRGAPGPVALEEPGFRPRDLVGDRYRIVRFLARGSTSEVYEAVDAELAASVALKVLRPSTLTSARGVRHFQRELELARRVTHPHVCRVYDLGFHGSPPARTAFISMQLLTGPTLAEHLQRRGPLPPDRALALAAQLASALSAAHDAGVLHRDLKSQNIVLTAGHSEDDPWAVVTDFGTARLLDAAVPGLTADGKIVGTPTHIAPEQLLGGALSPRTDVYAFGVVLFEMVTARLPFEGATPFETARLRLVQRPRAPRDLAPHLDARWDRVLARCLALDPAARFARPEHVVEALRAPPRPRWPRRATIAVAVMSMSMSMSVGLAAILRDRGSPAPPRSSAAPQPPPPALAVLPPEVSPDLPPWTGVALGELVAADLAGGSAREVVAPAASRRGLAALALEPGAHSTARDAAGAAALGAGALISVAIEGAPGALVARVVVRGAGAEADDVSRVGPAADVPALAAGVARRLRSDLGLPEVSPADAAAARAVLPPSAAALEWTAAGVEAEGRGDLTAAREALERATGLAPEHPAPAIALARLWARSGDARRARAALERAYELGAALPQERRLELEAEVRAARGARSDAVKTRRLLAELHPGARGPILELSKALREAGDAEGAQRALAGHGADDPFIALETAAVHQAVYANAEARSAAQRAHALAEAWGARPLMADARLAEAVAEKYLGHLDVAALRAEEASAAFDALADRRGVARALAVLGDTRLRQSRFGEARQIQERVLRIARGLSDGALIGLALHDIARVHRAEGEQAAASRLAREALAHFEAVDDRQHALWSLELLTDAYVDLGRPDDARETAERALALARELSARIDEAYGHNNLGITHVSQGALTEAERELAEAQRRFAELGADADLAFSRASSSQLALLRGDGPEALAQARSAREAAERAGSAEAIAEAQRQLGECALADGRFAEARSLIDAALAAFAALGVRVQEARAEILRGELAAREGAFAEARARAARAEKLARDRQVVPVELAAANLAARVELAAGYAGDGLLRARALERRARPLAWREARAAELTLALALAEAGRRAEAGARFARVERSAAAAGAEALTREARFGQAMLRSDGRGALAVPLERAGLSRPPLGYSTRP